MYASINGIILPAEEAKVSVYDRSFCYGDGLFETVRIHRGQPLLWAAHMRRFADAAREMSLYHPFTPAELLEAALALLLANRIVEGVLRMHLSRGVGARGYSIHGADRPVLVLTASHLSSAALSVPPRRVVVAETVRVPGGDRFTWFKSANRLYYVAARSEAEASGCDDAIVLNVRGEVADFSSASLMLLRSGVLIQPPLSSGRLDGVMSAWLVEHSGLVCREESIVPASLETSDAVLYLSSIAGVTWVSHVGASELRTGPTANQLQALWGSWASENLPSC